MDDMAAPAEPESDRSKMPRHRLLEHRQGPVEDLVTLLENAVATEALADHRPNAIGAQQGFATLRPGSGHDFDIATLVREVLHSGIGQQFDARVLPGSFHK